MRLIFMGTGPFAVPSFKALADSPHELVVLVTKADKEVRSRSKAPRNPMRDAASEIGISLLSPPDINDRGVIRQLASLRPDLLVVCDYGQILSADALAVARLGGINLHGSLLPKYRGAAPVQWAVLNGDRESGVSVIHMTPKLDAGPCLTQVRTEIGAEETAEQLESRLAELGVQAVHDAIETLDSWDGTSEMGAAQVAGEVSRAPRLKKADGEVDWTRPAEAIRNQVRGLKPWPGTYTYLNRDGRQPLRLILDRVSTEASGTVGEPGAVVQVTAEALAVGTGSGLLLIHEVQPAGKRVMPVGEFQRGHSIEVGMVFGPNSAG